MFDILQTTFSKCISLNESISIFVAVSQILFLRVQLAIFIPRYLGNGLAPNKRNLINWINGVRIHIRVTGPQWVYTKRRWNSICRLSYSWWNYLRQLSCGLVSDLAYWRTRPENILYKGKRLLSYTWLCLVWTSNSNRSLTPPQRPSWSPWSLKVGFLFPMGYWWNILRCYSGGTHTETLWFDMWTRVSLYSERPRGAGFRSVNPAERWRENPARALARAVFSQHLECGIHRSESSPEGSFALIPHPVARWAKTTP